jgi:hypothetical protein
MPDFDSRMEQLLASLGKLAPGHRERLVRPVRQHDLVCWPGSSDSEHAPAMKAAMRVAVHELLDQMCFQLEGVLTRCASESTQALVLAATSLAMADGMRVEFCDGEAKSGVSYPGSETLAIEVLPDDRLKFEYFGPAGKSPTEPLASYDVAVDPSVIGDDPFRATREIIEQLRRSEQQN